MHTHACCTYTVTLTKSSINSAVLRHVFARFESSYKFEEKESKLFFFLCKIKTIVQLKITHLLP